MTITISNTNTNSNTKSNSITTNYHHDRHFNLYDNDNHSFSL